jgi:hypothetical protein
VAPFTTKPVTLRMMRLPDDEVARRAAERVLHETQERVVVRLHVRAAGVRPDAEALKYVASAAAIAACAAASVVFEVR